MTVHSMVEGCTHERCRYRWVVGSARLHEANRDDVNYVTLSHTCRHHSVLADREVRA